jgi:hypothetical protein
MRLSERLGDEPDAGRYAIGVDATLDERVRVSGHAAMSLPALVGRMRASRVIVVEDLVDGCAHLGGALMRTDEVVGVGHGAAGGLGLQAGKTLDRPGPVQLGQQSQGVADPMRRRSWL